MDFWVVPAECSTCSGFFERMSQQSINSPKGIAQNFPSKSCPVVAPHDRRTVTALFSTPQAWCCHHQRKEELGPDSQNWREERRVVRSNPSSSDSRVSDERAQRECGQSQDPFVLSFQLLGLIYLSQGWQINLSLASTRDSGWPVSLKGLRVL